MLAGNDNIQESLDEFEIQSDLIRDHRVCCSCVVQFRPYCQV